MTQALAQILQVLVLSCTDLPNQHACIVQRTSCFEQKMLHWEKVMEAKRVSKSPTVVEFPESAFMPEEVTFAIACLKVKVGK